MKKLTILLFICTLSILQVDAQEKYGNTINLGLGIGGYSGYYGYVGRNMPVITFNYEIDAAKNFTIAPFVSYYSYKSKYYYGNPGNGYKYYNYTETVIPIGIKGSYYFDSFLQANSKWDFYLAGSLGASIRRATWDSDYTGDKYAYNRASQLFLDFHIGTEYHLNSKIGAFLDLSNGVSTFGLAFHGI